ncbi:MAG: SUMF1/EgtB/PvdO family nonheme iron enzyme [Chloroflexota bacterium]|nr:SUMF1/EgtB/PvdO family nonheme iron enzyme [Chloroflexota bacterium]
MPKKHENVNTGGGSYINGDVHVHDGDFVGRDQGKAGRWPSLDLDSSEAEAARQRYREALRARYNIIETHAFSALANDAEVGSPRRLPLLGEKGAYVPLTFDLSSTQGDYSDALRKVARDSDIAQILEKDQAQVSDEELSAIPRTGPASLIEVLGFPGHVAIIGDAGSGKTTILKVISSVLAAKDPAKLAPEFFTVFLRDPLPIPVFMPLRFFEQACCDQNLECTRCPDDLLHFTDAWFQQWYAGPDLPAHFLEAHLRAGRAWLLLDALDEVADADHRETVRNVLQTLAGQLPETTRLIVTARVSAYRNTRLDDRFTVVTVRDLDDDQRKQLVHGIYQGLALSDHRRRADELATRFNRSEALQDLGRTPVMVWTSAVIHALRGELPESRAALYDAYVDILLKQSFKRTRGAVEALTPLIDSEDWPLADRRHYLTYAAFKVHALLETQPERQADRQVVVGEDELINDVLAPYFHENLGDTLRKACDRAREFVTLMVERSGLLYENEQGYYSFGDHLTMQEFLAAYYLAENYPLEEPLAYAQFLQEKAGRSWWREVVLLAAGYLGQTSGFQGRKFLQQLTRNRDESETALAFLALAGRGLLQLRAGRKRPTWYKGLAQDFANRLYARLYAEPTDAPIPVRQEAGLVLGRLYGLPGDETGVGDPRCKGSQSLPDFIRIPAGAFWMGSDDSDQEDEHPRHEVYLDTYDVAKYPTTNATYAHFIAASGYGDERWWEAAIEDDFWKNGQVKDYWTEDWHSLPRYWNDARLNNPSQPVVGVNWYEAVAYCRWLTATLDDGYVYRLPTEAEWERAARGPQGWAYPWGADWREGLCNSQEAGLEQTSPVGLFPPGATSEGVHELVGNVYEWCRDWYAEDAYAESNPRNPNGPESGKSRVLRGGSWYSDGPSRCRCGFRGGGDPRGWYSGRGFRCVRILSSVP